MLYSVATVSMTGSFEEKLLAIYKAGFKGIELYVDDPAIKEWLKKTRSTRHAASRF